MSVGGRFTTDLKASGSIRLLVFAILATLPLGCSIPQVGIRGGSGNDLFQDLPDFSKQQIGQKLEESPQASASVRFLPIASDPAESHPQAPAADPIEPMVEEAAASDSPPADFLTSGDDSSPLVSSASSPQALDPSESIQSPREPIEEDLSPAPPEMALATDLVEHIATDAVTPEATESDFENTSEAAPEILVATDQSPHSSSVPRAPISIALAPSNGEAGDEPFGNWEGPNEADEEAAGVALSIATDATAGLFLQPDSPQELAYAAASDPQNPALTTTSEQAGIKPITQVGVDIDPASGAFPTNDAAIVFAKRPEVHYTSQGPPDVDFGYYWQSPEFCHRSLYFEQPNLERYGRHAGVLQPLISGAHFFATVPTLPYQIALEGPRACCTHPDYGYDCAPRQGVLPRWGTAAGIIEAGAITGLIFLIP